MMKRAKLTAQQQKKRDVLLDVLTVLFACPLISAAIAVFNVPNDIAPGGVAGLSTALAEVFPPISVGVWMVMLNTPLLFAAWRRFKRRALVMTLAATGSVAVLVDIFGLLLPAYSNNPLLARSRAARSRVSARDCCCKEGSAPAEQIFWHCCCEGSFRICAQEC